MSLALTGSFVFSLYQFEGLRPLDSFLGCLEAKCQTKSVGFVSLLSVKFVGRLQLSSFVLQVSLLSLGSLRSQSALNGFCGSPS